MKQSLAYRAAMSELIEFNLECADPTKLKKANQNDLLATPPAFVNIHHSHFRTGDDEFDLIQDSAENDYRQDYNEGRANRFSRAAFHAE